MLRKMGRKYKTMLFISESGNYGRLNFIYSFLFESCVILTLENILKLESKKACNSGFDTSPWAGHHLEGSAVSDASGWHTCVYGLAHGCGSPTAWGHSSTTYKK